MEVERSVLAERLSRRRCLQLAAGVALGAAGFGIGGCGSGSGARDNGGSLANRSFTVTEVNFPNVGVQTISGINERGDVIGNVRARFDVPIRAYRWRDGTLTDTGIVHGPIPPPNDGTAGSAAIAVNDSGVVLVHNSGDLFLWKDGQATQLALPAKVSFDAPPLLSQQGAILYQEEVSSSLPRGSYPVTSIPVTWRDGVRQPIVLPGYDTAVHQTRLLSVSDNGTILGRVEETGNLQGSDRRPGIYFVISGEQVTFLEGVNSYPEEWGPGTIALVQINDRGQIRGRWQSPAMDFGLGDPPFAFVWENGRFTKLEQDGLSAHGTGMNNSGVVVGYRGSNTTEYTATLWEDGKAYEINTRIPNNPGGQLGSAEAINDRGQIICGGTFNGRSGVFLLTPV